MPSTSKNKPRLQVERELGSGAEGAVVLAKTPQGKKAIKYYYSQDPQVKEELLQRIIEISSMKRPSKHFVMPEKALKIRSSKGILIGMQMEVLPDQFIPLSKLASFDVDLPVRGLLMVAINLTLAMSKLHAAGLQFGDLSLANIYFHPSTFAVKIIDCGNICAQSNYCLGTPGFMAPEIANRTATNSQLSERLSLAIVIFVILVRQNPFHGCKLDSIPFRKFEDEFKHLSQSPLYIFNQLDRSNWLPSDHHAHKLFSVFSPIHNAFHSSFVDGLGNPQVRLAPVNWLEKLISLHCRVVNCRCGAQNIYVSRTECWHCDQSLTLFGRLKIQSKFGVHRIAVADGAAIYPHHVSAKQRFNFEYPLGLCKRSNGGKRQPCLRNLSTDDWFVSSAGKSVSPGRSIGLGRNWTLNFAACNTQVDFRRF